MRSISIHIVDAANMHTLQKTPPPFSKESTRRSSNHLAAAAEAENAGGRMPVNYRLIIDLTSGLAHVLTRHSSTSISSVLL